MPTVLATGGAGYIGSHVVTELMAAGWRVVVIDDFSNAEPSVADRIGEIGVGQPQIVTGDLRDPALVDEVFRHHHPDAVVHLAGLKAVGESVERPVEYYDVNLGGATVLLRTMQRHGVARLVFSSSATVYGTPERNPIDEASPLGATSPYGRTKLFTEALLSDLAAAWPEFGALSLRYFNPVGAHASGLIGEHPRGAPNNLFPYIAQTAAGLRPRLRVFGNDYPTPDGTGVRDYIHVVDVALGHIAALEYLMGGEGIGRNLPINLGCGRGYSVLEAISAFERATGREIPCEFVDRRAGDVAECVADARRAEAVLGWRATRDLETMCADHWVFQSRLMLPAT